jgi:IS4 transposase
LRRVIVRVEVDGQEGEMEFLSNHLDWSAWTIAELYRCRWQIEVFFKEIKQTLQLSDFLGHSENAVRWQVWIGLLVHLLLRYLAWVHGWAHSFTRLFTVVRAVPWRRWSLLELLRRYGTAGGSFRLLGQPEQAYLLGMG